MRILFYDSVANLNSTPMWNLILQISLYLSVEFTYSENPLYLFIQIWLLLPGSKETKYEHSETFNT